VGLLFVKRARDSRTRRRLSTCRTCLTLATSVWVDKRYFDEAFWDEPGLEHFYQTFWARNIKVRSFWGALGLVYVSDISLERARHGDEITVFSVSDVYSLSSQDVIAVENNRMVVVKVVYPYSNPP
jgi:hypothetical protein